MKRVLKDQNYHESWLPECIKKETKHSLHLKNEVNIHELPHQPPRYLQCLFQHHRQRRTGGIVFRCAGVLVVKWVTNIRVLDKSWLLPRKLAAGTWKSPLWKGESSSKPPFLGSILVFWVLVVGGLGWWLSKSQENFSSFKIYFLFFFRSYYA